MLDNNQRAQNIIKLYFSLGAGSLNNPEWIRHRAIFVQMMMLLASIVPALMWDWNVDEATGISWLIGTLWSLGAWASTLYWTFALILSLRDNLPKMVKTKNSMGLFLFTLLFFEAGILCFLFWFLGIALWFTGTPLCRSLLCSGIINGLFAYVNVLALICIYAVLRAKRTLGIGFLDAFGL